MRLLCTGDLHLGRRSSRVAAPATDLSARGAWERIVSHAISTHVDAVLLSGDIVDAANRFFEAVGPLERGLQQLSAAGIPAIAVAGNHDFDVLPALARALPHGTLHLLGVGGTWERYTLTNTAGERVHVDGWSFASRHESGDPLATYEPHANDGIPVVGLLHTDLDAAGSQYAPTTQDALLAQPICCWLLGHLHAGGHRERPANPPLLYPGSPQPLDPGEPGAHGAWMVDVSPSGAVSTRLVPLATVRYDTLSVDLAPCSDVADARETVRAAVQQWCSSTLVACGPLQHVALRLQLSGRTALHGTVAPLAAELLEWNDLLETGDGHTVAVSVTQVERRTEGHYELAALAARRDAIGWLAQLLHDINARGSAAVDRALWQELRAIPNAIQQVRPYRGVDLAAQWDDAALASAVRTQAELLLDQLLQQADGRS